MSQASSNEDVPITEEVVAGGGPEGGVVVLGAHVEEVRHGPCNPGASTCLAREAAGV